MTQQKREKIYFLGIGGTGMAAVAGLFQEAGFAVTGSDAGVYPPMSLMLDELGIKVRSPYAAANLDAEKPDMIVVANVLSRGNEELERAIASGVPYTSFPALLGERILAERTTVVVAGTHGKTTTTSLLAHALDRLGEEPGFVIGGLPRNFPRSFRLGKGKLFAIEGDEYDTAFFDKGPKFLHYRPSYCILNNLEYDHADIYPNLEAIEAQFEKLARLLPDPARIIANADDPGITHVLARMGLLPKVTRVATLGRAQDAAVRVVDTDAGTDGEGRPRWRATLATRTLGSLRVETELSGHHNIANIAQVVACLEQLQLGGELKRKLRPEAVADAIASFAGVARRLDLIGRGGGVDVYEDFAHHPTAVRTVIEGFRAMYPDRRVVVAFEPRSATQRRNVFQDGFAKALALADRVYIGECPLDKRISEENRMNTASMQAAIGTKAKAFPTNAALLEALSSELAPGDSVIFMSSGSFSGAQYKLAEALKAR
jgi:UDP-N-acetylmuramate: L-alanyl-gamma-D-glutamyl-meso-diaminopimelate ligase